MQASSSFKCVFLQKFLLGLKLGSFSTKKASILERKKAIKLTSDVALASASEGAIWSRAIMANCSKGGTHKKMELEKVKKKPWHQSLRYKRVGSKRILRRIYAVRRIRKSAPTRVLASCIARRMVKKRTLVLKNLIPGGGFMDELSLLEETVDYILSLRAQVDVMRSLVNEFELSDSK